ncbi:MAG: hypothetical protein KAI17_16795, partial [Thiotrichaceae bacterium]|nr:hypothetical protein [Thiotrichaceae bacterium]
MNTSTQLFTPVFSGAWLTDIDDTLIPSGHRPDEQWIACLADFIRSLKQHNILWAPVSGVAIAKMGERLLYRLPADVLSNVIYYGGEGSTKSYFDEKKQVWCHDENFQQNFNDAQTLALIGKERFINALELSESMEQSNTRIKQAEAKLFSAEFSKPCLIDEMETLLQQQGFDNKRAETYYRGGAISWMMLGDKSVNIYKGNKESDTRSSIRDFAQTWLEDNNALLDLGSKPVNMPYKHATRGIKMVLQGNDKGRAADDLIKTYHLSAASILFMGNELFNGGNDNSVRRVPGIRLLSVGEKEDFGVINGGVDVIANKSWMEWFADNLQQGSHWHELLKKVPLQAHHIRLVQAINKERQRNSDLSAWHQKFTCHISSAGLADIILRHRPVLENTRHALVSLRNIEYQLLARLAVLPDYHYDEARKITYDLANEVNSLEDYQAYLVVEKILGLLIAELKAILKQNYADQYDISINLIDEHINNIQSIDDVFPEFDKLFIYTPHLDYAAEKNKITNLLNNWKSRIELFVKDWFDFQVNWKNKKNIEQALLLKDNNFIQANSELNKEDIYLYFCRLIPRVLNFPHLKDLNKPTIVLVAGTSGVGKSTLSQYISKTLGISTYFSTDVTSRSVMRNAFSYVFGDISHKIFPELYGSSFDKDSMHWFYNQSLLSMIGSSGSIERLVKENVSAVIDGVSLIPGTLAERYFEIANIVWIVACIKDENIH